MTKANDLASLLDANGDVVSSALDNVPAAPTPSLSSLGIANHDDITVDGSGRVGIGVTPASKLHVDGSFRQTGATAPFEWTVNAGANDYYKLNSVGYYDNIIIATAAGSVGIGVNPGTRLDVGDTSSNTVARIRNLSGGGTNTNASFQLVTANNYVNLTVNELYNYSQFQHAGNLASHYSDVDNHHFRTKGGVAKMLIDSNGQVGLSGSATSFDTTGLVNGLQLYYETSNGNATIGTYSNGGGTFLNFHTNTGGAASTKKLQINNLGKLETTGRDYGFHNHGTAVSLADDASIVINAGTAGGGILAIYETSSGQWAVFGVGYAGASIMSALNSAVFDVSDTDGRICVISSGHTITIKNRLGNTRGFYINMFMAGNSFAG